jgi:hypothetical protein
VIEKQANAFNVPIVRLSREEISESWSSTGPIEKPHHHAAMQMITGRRFLFQQGSIEKAEAAYKQDE